MSDICKILRTLQSTLYYSVLGIILFPLLASAATVRVIAPIGRQPVVISPQGKQVVLYKESHALLISASNYSGGGWKRLPATQNELDELGLTLAKHGFRVTRVTDPTGAELSQVIREFSAEFGREPNSRVIIMFSGHGYTRPGNKMGYLVPVDAPDPQNAAVFYSRAMAIKQLELTALEIEAKHALFMFDSCFSGSIFTTKSHFTQATSMPDDQESRWRFLSQKSQEPVRQFLSAGGANEELPAKSEFIPLLIRGLSGRAGIRRDQFLTGKELGQWIEQTLPSINPRQNPHSDVIREGSFVWGDMVFQIESGPETTVQTKIAEKEPAIAADESRKSEETAASTMTWMSYSLPWPASGPHITNAKGIDIFGKVRQPIYVVRTGQVVYVGSSLRGYGQMVLVKHEASYVTAYAHTSKILVQEGDFVYQGQKIAEMGKTDTDRVKLHFEIRKHGEPVDPLNYLMLKQGK